MTGSQARFGLRDKNPTFLNTTCGNANFLHIDTSVATQLESAGANVAGITDDFDGNIRQGNPGYAGSGTSPDIGADEFSGIPMDITPPVITYAPLANTASMATGCWRRRSLTEAECRRWGYLPVLISKGMAGAFTAAQATPAAAAATPSPSMECSVADDWRRDSILCGRADTAATPNVGANPSTAAFTTNPPAAGTRLPEQLCPSWPLPRTFNVKSAQPALQHLTAATPI
jgi:hypothetical protein